MKNTERGEEGWKSFLNSATNLTHPTRTAWVHPVPPAGAPLRARLLSLPPVTNAHRHPPLDTARCCQPQVLIRRPRLQRPSSTGVETCGHDRRSVRHSPIELPPPPLVPPSSPARAAAISTATTTTPPACLAYPCKGLSFSLFNFIGKRSKRFDT